MKRLLLALARRADPARRDPRAPRRAPDEPSGARRARSPPSPSNRHGRRQRDWPARCAFQPCRPACQARATSPPSWRCTVPGGHVPASLERIDARGRGGPVAALHVARVASGSAATHPRRAPRCGPARHGPRTVVTSSFRRGRRRQRRLGSRRPRQQGVRRWHARSRREPARHGLHADAHDLPRASATTKKTARMAAARPPSPPCSPNAASAMPGSSTKAASSTTR